MYVFCADRVFVVAWTIRVAPTMMGTIMPFIAVVLILNGTSALLVPVLNVLRVTPHH